MFGPHIGPEDEAAARPGGRVQEDEFSRVAAVEMPDLVHAEAVQRREIRSGDQELDRRGACSPIGQRRPARPNGGKEPPSMGKGTSRSLEINCPASAFIGREIDKVQADCTPFRLPVTVAIHDAG